jgi:ribosomal protein S16
VVIQFFDFLDYLFIIKFIVNRSNKCRDKRLENLIMLVIRLKPVGRKHQISYRIVVTEKRSKLNGPYREDLGFYNPRTDKFSVNAERAKYWLSIGAQPSDTVYNILVDAQSFTRP